MMPIQPLQRGHLALLLLAASSSSHLPGIAAGLDFEPGCDGKSGRPILPQGASVKDLELSATDPALVAGCAERFRRFGSCVIRGLNNQYVGKIREDTWAFANQSLELEAQGKAERTPEGWATPDGTLFIPAHWKGTGLEDRRFVPIKDALEAHEKNHGENATCDLRTCAEGLMGVAGGGDLSKMNRVLLRDGQLRTRQIMVLGLDYRTSATLLKCAIDDRLLDVVAGILGEDVELFGRGQLVYKEPSGGHEVSFHQDSAFFEFEGFGPVGTLNYAVDTSADDEGIGNAPLYVYPGSHGCGYVPHVDTASHLGLPREEWGLEKAVRIDGKAGDTILFHQHLIHGSPPNRGDAPRPTFINRYTRPSERVIMPLATSVEMRRKAVAEVKEKGPSKRELGYMVRGRRAYDENVWQIDSDQQHH